ncbi:hypothetical protein SAMN05444008_11272 [Cnuella takakiae]|uniref:SMODS and SLOG-associating 2TM effector domain-containing protein n=1 Tax=Cnuella takakiae TaxID=1302690 RepID=A0A1M5EJH9_9BACT|nr:SLATT domain-containing protein [Cnuella takakiae]OLY91198.1 hypothetical protein BUE76_04260 [Cnuella takakiae]SHF79385.1 hypothetical protein SAMN05444008_11272 [Cnuella takakiae]
MNEIPATKDELLRRWHKRLRETQSSHYEAAKPLGSLNYKLGVPVVILTTFVGTSVFATLSKDVNIYFKIATGLISVAAAVLSSIQTFLRFNERAELHRSTAAQAGSIRRLVEEIIASGNLDDLSREEISKIRERIDKLSENAPSIKAKTWEKTKKILAES